MKQKYVLIRSRCFWLLLAVFCCLARSCSDPYVSESLSEDVSTSFSLLLPHFGAPSTYADNLTVAKDLEIENVTILVFSVNADSTGLFLYSRTNVKLVDNNKFTVGLKPNENRVRVHVFVNAPVGSLAEEYYEQKEKDVLESIETDMDLNASSTYTIPMHGCIELPSVILGDKENVDKRVQLLRSVARVDVKVTSDALTTFRLHGVAVYFTPKSGCLVSTSKWLGTSPNLSVSSPTMPTGCGIFDTEGAVPYAGVASDDPFSITNNLFIYENEDYTKIDACSQRNSRMVVSGYYNASTELSYYPVDFRKTNGASKEFVPILRNHQYVLNVASVGGGGYDNEKEAANSVPIDIVASITAWTPMEDESIFDGINYFYVKEKSLTLYGDANIQNSLAVGSNVDPADWEMSWGSADHYQKETRLTGSHFTVEKPIKKEDAYLTFTTENAFLQDVSEVLHIRVTDQLKFTITVNQRDGSILTVDGKTKAFDVNVPHIGGFYRFKVLTGSNRATWKALPDDPLIKMIYNYKAVGDDLTVDIEPNPYNVQRSGTMTVSRDGGGAADVILNFIQKAPTN